MNTHTRCPHCRETNSIPFGTLGKAVTCEHCRRIFVSSLLTEKERQEAAKASGALVPFSDEAAQYSVKDIELDLVRIGPGSFTMGNALGSADERPEHEAVLTRSMYFAICPVTQLQYRRIMEDSPSYFEGEENPVETVSWHQAMEFCRRLTEREKVGDRLPGGVIFKAADGNRVGICLSYRGRG